MKKEVQLSVILPVYNELQLTDSLLSQISANSILPDEIIIIDNGSIDNTPSLKKKYKKLNIKYIKNTENMGVCWAWNQGFKMAEGNLISVLNNDIIINSDFFKKIVQPMRDRDTGLVIPTTVLDKYMVIVDPREAIIEDYPHRQGWAFTIKKEVIDKIGLIPKELKLWFGDDYIFEKTRKADYKVKIIKNNFIYHKTSSTLQKINFIPMVEEDKRQWLINKERWLAI